MAMQEQRDDALEVFDVNLQVLSGSKLPAKDIGGKSDPFVKIFIADQTAQTKVIKNNLNPQFNETFSFRFLSNPRAIRFEVMDKDKLSDDKMGTATFNLEELFAAPQRTFDGDLKLDQKSKSKGTLKVRINAQRFDPRAQNELITKQGETISRQERVISQQKEMLSKQNTRIDNLQRSLAQAEAQAMSAAAQAQPGPGSASAAAATKRPPTLPTAQIKAKAVTKMKETKVKATSAMFVAFAQIAAVWQIVLAALYAIPFVDELVLALGSLLRLGSGLTVLKGATTSKRPPTKMLKLYDREGSAECKMVREVLSSLDLDCIIYPVPEVVGKSGTTRFGGEAQRLSGQTGASALPVLVDENYGDDGPLILLNAAQIVQYLYDEYGNNVQLSVVDRVRNKIVQHSAMTALYGAYLAVLRSLPAQGKKMKGTVQPGQLLELWGYEASPFCTKVREVLCGLEIGYVLKNVAHGSQQKRGEFQIRFGKKYPAWKQKVQALQLPLLIDGNTNTELFNVREIEKYLVNTYCAEA